MPDEFKSQVYKSAYNVREIEKTQLDIDTMSECIAGVIKDWRDNQLEILNNLKANVTAQQKSCQTATKELKRLSRQDDTDVNHLITRLREVRALDKTLKSCKSLTKVRYNFTNGHHALVKQIQSAFQSQSLPSSKLLNRENT